MVDFPNTGTADGVWSLKQVRRAVLGNYWPEVTIQATGGTVTDITDGGVNYRVHTFTSSGTFEVTGGAGDVEFLVVGGGGAGSGRHGGGGGAGGLVFVPGFNISTGSYSVTVGEGGTGAQDTFDNGSASKGSDSTFDNIVALGGGRPGNQDTNESGGDGGSGGGGNYFSSGTTSIGGSGLQPNQSGFSGAPYGFGNDGGDALRTSGSAYPGGGGGGAGGIGESATNLDAGGDGGIGKFEATIDGTTYNFASLFGLAFGEISNSETYFAGGGAGGVWQESSPGTGGLGGGGNGGQANTSRPAADGEDAIANTGGGGGGAGGDSRDHFGGDGGSGIVIIRYQI